MMGEDKNLEMASFEGGDELLRQLFHLKRYETPEVARMTRNRQNIMREVREIGRTKRKSFSDLLEINCPWLFAEPKYGVAILLVAFAGLQYLGINARHAANSNTGIYTTSPDRFAAYGQSAAVSSNHADYAEVPDNFRLFENQHGNGEVKWVANPSPTWQK